MYRYFKDFQIGEVYKLQC